jgi:uncharacterized membrane protein
MTKNFLKHLRTKVFAGILLLLPLGITFLVLKFVFNTLDSILGPLMPPVTIFLFDRLFEIPGLGIIAFFLMLYLIGVFATNVLGRKMVQWTDWVFTNIPVVKNIYLSSKQLTDAFSTSRKGAFRQAVFVEFPQPGNYVLGFVTNELKAPVAQAKITVFVPTAFFPPQGFLLFLSREKVIPSSFTIEDAIKAIMSVGIVTPNGQSLRLPEPSPPPPSQGETIANFPEMKYVNSKPEGGL